jgi:hypothetical protein
MTKKLMILGLLLAATFAACIVPVGGPGMGPGPRPGMRPLSSGEVRALARDAVYDYVRQRFGPASRPRVSSPSIRRYMGSRAEVVGSVIYYRGPRAVVRRQFRCYIDRFERRVYDIDIL